MKKNKYVFFLVLKPGFHPETCGHHRRIVALVCLINWHYIVCFKNISLKLIFFLTWFDSLAFFNKALCLLLLVLC